FPFDESLLESDISRSRIEDYLLQLNPQVRVSEGHYAIGDLTGDEIPEIAMYIQRNPENIDDQGSLIIYGYESSSYSILDEVPMNYDNTNYILKTGKISESQNGILLSNQVGSKAGVTYGFILKDGKLLNILNPKKVNLFSVKTSNTIQDIDDDGVLEFSIYAIDPETQAGDSSEADTIQIWYKWNGNDGADVVLVEKESSDQLMTMAAPRDSLAMDSPMESQSADIAVEGPNPGSYGYKEHLFQSLDDRSIQDVTVLLEEHLFSLQVNKSYRSLDIAAMFSKYMKDYSFDSLFEKYGLSQERLNDREYLQRDRILQSEPDLKEMLLTNLDLGYFLVIQNGKYSYEIDYKSFVDDFGTNVTNEFRKYLQIMAKEKSAPYKDEDSLLIDKPALAERILEIESFRLTYSYSDFLEEVLLIYKDYMNSMLYLTQEGSVIDEETGSFKGDSREILQEIVNVYPDSHMSDVINLMLEKIKASNERITPAIREEISSMIP
ncbi:MAG: hypothetical protein ACQEP4_08870, partial [Bacillota bacterium]